MDAFDIGLDESVNIDVDVDQNNILAKEDKPI